jgi:hypothetical protein
VPRVAPPTSSNLLSTRAVQVCAMSCAILLAARPQSHERRRNAGPRLLARDVSCETPRTPICLCQ